VLVFLFISTHELDVRQPVAELAKVKQPIPMRGANREDAMVFVVPRSGDVWLGNQLLQWNDVQPRIREAVNHGAEKKVYIRADARAKYTWVRELLESVHSAGIENVAFLVEKENRF
jgi:biopolymer transport protein TolR